MDNPSFFPFRFLGDVNGLKLANVPSAIMKATASFRERGVIRSFLRKKTWRPAGEETNFRSTANTHTPGKDDRGQAPRGTGTRRAFGCL